MRSVHFYMFLRALKWFGFWLHKDATPEEIETAKSTALEIVNPENMLMKMKDGWAIVTGPTSYMEVRDGELYPWDGEVEHIASPKPIKEHYGYKYPDWNSPGGESAYEETFIAWQTSQGVFKLLPKQKETSLDQNDFDTEEEFFKACREQREGEADSALNCGDIAQAFKDITPEMGERLTRHGKFGGIVATGEPEQDHPNRKAQIDHWKDVYIDFRDGEGWKLFAERNRLKYFICENNEIDSLRDQLAYLTKFHDAAQVELPRLQEELAKANQELNSLKTQRCELRSILVVRNEEVADQHRDIGFLKEELAKAEDMKEYFRQGVNGGVKEIHRLTQELAKAKEENAILKKRVG